MVEEVVEFARTLRRLERTRRTRVDRMAVLEAIMLSGVSKGAGITCGEDVRL